MPKRAVEERGITLCVFGTCLMPQFKTRMMLRHSTLTAVIF